MNSRRGPSRVSLPIDAHLPACLEALERSRNLILKASPGAGKTTRLPPALLHAPWRKPEQEVLVLEPRRLAAKLSATRVAEELGEALGETVGYQFRFERVGGSQTRLHYLTEGLLMRRLLDDPTLKRVAAVVLDEFHERHLAGDLAFAFLRRLQQTTRPDLRLVVMSATLETDLLVRALADEEKSPPPCIEVTAPRYPVQLRYLEKTPTERDLVLAVQRAIAQEWVREDSGSILVFLPGMAEIRRVESAISSEPFGRFVFALHGELDPREQARALAEPLGPSDRKIILSTNVAESSLTIPGVRTVIDSGLARVASHQASSGLPALRTRPISKAAAVQRAGRAGRTAAGTCVRLYTLGDLEGRPAFEVPEIERADLAQPVLELACLGVSDLAGLPWVESPTPAAIRSAVELLARLGFLTKGSASDADEALQPTELGRRWVSIPLHPRLLRLLQEGFRLGVVDGAIRLAAFLSEDRVEEEDFEALWERLAQGKGLGFAVKRQEERLHRSLRRGGLEGGTSSDSAPSSGLLSESLERIARAVLAAFPDRIAKRLRATSPTEVELQLVSGGTVRARQGPTGLQGEWFVALDIQSRQHSVGGKTARFARGLCRIEDSWLLDLPGGAGVQDVTSVEWNPVGERVEVTSTLRIGELVLEQTRLRPEQVALDAARAFVKVLRTRNGAGLGDETAVFRGWQSRIEYLDLRQEVLPPEARRVWQVARSQSGDSTISVEGVFDARLTEACARFEVFSVSRLLELGVEALIAEAWGADIMELFRNWVPEFLPLAHGRKLRISYAAPQDPWAESWLQDFFGTTEVPSVLAGKVRLVLHLLAPNRRPIQVTQDLASFWKGVYPELRPALSRRYPRHSWPDDPVRALPPAPRSRRNESL